MKREIKFRAYRKSTQNVCDVLSIDFEKGWVLLDDGDEEEIPTVEFMQFTGLHDKNGREIYEGDLITFNTTCGSVGVLEVKFDKGTFQPLDDMTLAYAHDIKVIGNIYENPELMEVSDDE